MGVCHIIKHKGTGEEILIPYCGGVGNNMHLDMSDREIIKEYCYCDRAKREKYETKTRDEVFVVINNLKGVIMKMEIDLGKLKQKLDGLEYEVFMLNAVEVDIPDS